MTFFELRHKYRMYLLAMLVVLAIFGIFAFLLWQTGLSFSGRLGLMTFLLIGLGIAIFILNLNILRIQGAYKMNRLLHFKDDSWVNGKKNLLTESWVDVLKTNGFVSSKDHGDFLFFYRFAGGKNRRTIGTGDRLEVFVYLKDPKLEFGDDSILAGINEIKKPQSKRQRVTKVSIIQLKKTTRSKKDSMQEAEQIYFDRIDGQNIVFINVMVDPSSHKMYYLRSYRYTPNLMYRETLELVEKFLYR